MLISRLISLANSIWHQKGDHSSPYQSFIHPTVYDGHIASNLQGFIHHPPSYPLRFRTLRRGQVSDHEAQTSGQKMGLCFKSHQYYPPGQHMEVMIEIKREAHYFTGEVVLVRSHEQYFEIGLWLDRPDSVAKLRILEQLCHIEAYTRHKHHHEGPFVSPEYIAREWISRYASSFPNVR